jgi:hypothetical protein
MLQRNTPVLRVYLDDSLRYSSFRSGIFLDEVRYAFLVVWILTLFQID